MKYFKNVFSLMEILIVVVMVSVFSLGGITIACLSIANVEEENLKKDAKEMLILAQNAYLNISKTESPYIVETEDGTKGMCISLRGLQANEYIEKIKKEYEGYIVIEDNGSDKRYSIWLTDKKLVINGYEYKKIMNLSKKNKEITKYTKENFSVSNKTEFSGATSSKGGFTYPTTYIGTCINEKIE